MGKNFSDRLKAEREAIQIAVQQTYTQFMMDMVSLTLNDPEVMGKDTFGYERLLRVLHGVEANFDKYADALTKRQTRTIAGKSWMRTWPGYVGTS